jgi:hypothetical protein
MESAISALVGHRFKHSVISQMAIVYFVVGGEGQMVPTVVGLVVATPKSVRVLVVTEGRRRPVIAAIGAVRSKWNQWTGVSGGCISAVTNGRDGLDRCLRIPAACVQVAGLPGHHHRNSQQCIASFHAKPVLQRLPTFSQLTLMATISHELVIR